MEFITFSLFIKEINTWNLRTKELFNLGIMTTVHDSNLYDANILLLREIFNNEQVDFIIWYIFNENNEIEIEDGSKIKIDNLELCWEYLNKLK